MTDHLQGRHVMGICPLLEDETCWFLVVFLAIHPFQDGNGRLSRVLTTLLLLRAGYAYVPYCSLESIIEQSKDAYYLALRRTQGKIRTDKPGWQPWTAYFLTALRQQKDRLEKKIAREQILRGTPPVRRTVLPLIDTSIVAVVHAYRLMIRDVI